jgi:hypothetical protein
VLSIPSIARIPEFNVEVACGGRLWIRKNRRPRLNEQGRIGLLGNSATRGVDENGKGREDGKTGDEVGEGVWSLKNDEGSFMQSWVRYHVSPRTK